MATISSNDKKILSPAKAIPKAATPPGAGKTGGAKVPGKRDALALTFERWARVEKPIQDTLTVLEGWVTRLPSTATDEKKTLAGMVKAVNALFIPLLDVRNGFGALSAKGFKPPAVGSGALTKGDTIKYKPAFLEKVLKMGGDPALWGGTWKVTSTLRTDTGNLFVMGTSIADPSVGIGPQPAFQFERV